MVASQYGHFSAMREMILLGLFRALLSPGGGIAIFGFSDPIIGVLSYVSDLSSGGKIYIDLVGLLWIILPGLIAAIATGMKMADDNGKSAFLGIFLSYSNHHNNSDDSWNRWSHHIHWPNYYTACAQYVLDISI